jgi:valyl-tRNA synthetase
MGRDIKLSEERIEGYRHFVNKLWNAARFALMHIAEGAPDMPLAEAAKAGLCHAAILSRLERLKGTVSAAIEGNQFNEAAQELYAFFWREFCDWYLEMAKVDLSGEDADRKGAAKRVLTTVLSEILTLMHPIMPYVTRRYGASCPKRPIPTWPRCLIPRPGRNCLGNGRGGSGAA